MPLLRKARYSRSVRCDQDSTVNFRVTADVDWGFLEVLTPISLLPRYFTLKYSFDLAYAPVQVTGLVAPYEPGMPCPVLTSRCMPP